MWLNLNVNGIKVQLRIKGYKLSNKECWDCQWCNCDFSFSSGDWLNYHKEDDEVLLSCEIEMLESTLSMLLNDEIKEDKEIDFIEPDFVFHIYPKDNLENYASDIYVEWKIYFWNGGLTENYIAITLDRAEIIILRDYLSSVIKNKYQ